MNPKKIVIAAGGTGGHLFPAQALAEQIQEKEPSAQILFMGAGLKTNRYFDRDRFAFHEIASSPLLLRSPLRLAQGIKNLFKGGFESLAFLREYKPAVIVGFGSYYTVAPLCAARWLSIPIILHEGNSIPGRANKWLSPLSEKVGIHFPSTAAFFGKKAVEVGLPLRHQFKAGQIAKQEALAFFGLSLEKKTVLICGGSQGAHAINQAAAHLASFFKSKELQLIHLAGSEAECQKLTAAYASCGLCAFVKPFESRMEMAWAACDLFIGRSGASTIAESMECEVPGILIPYPHATDNHQEKNADFLVETVQSGLKITQDKLTPSILQRALEQMMSDAFYVFSKNQLRKYKRVNQRLDFSDLVLSQRAL